MPGQFTGTHIDEKSYGTLFGVVYRRKIGRREEEEECQTVITSRAEGK
jgi:hypothetical protein